MKDLKIVDPKTPKILLNNVLATREIKFII